MKNNAILMIISIFAILSSSAVFAAGTCRYVKNGFTKTARTYTQEHCNRLAQDDGRGGARISNIQFRNDTEVLPMRR